VDSVNLSGENEIIIKKWIKEQRSNILHNDATVIWSELNGLIGKNDEVRDYIASVCGKFEVYLESRGNDSSEYVDTLDERDDELRGYYAILKIQEAKNTRGRFKGVVGVPIKAIAQWDDLKH